MYVASNQNTALAYQHIIFFYTHIYHRGGVPEDFKRLVDELNKSESITAIGIDKFTQLIQTIFRKDKVKIYIIGYSNPINWLAAFVLKIFLRVDYNVLTLNQLNDFLDRDNPFLMSEIPIVESLELKKASSVGKLTHWYNFKRSFILKIRRILKFLCNKTAGKVYLRYAEKLLVLSTFEREQIQLRMNLPDEKFQIYRLGADISDRDVDADRYPEDDSINIVVWSRLDFYYKGIVDILEAFGTFQEKIDKCHIKLYFIGPDYMGGVSEIYDKKKALKYPETVKILEPGKYTSKSLSLLKKAHFCVNFSKTDWLPRTAREASLLGTLGISNRECHLEDYYGTVINGFIVNDSRELSNLFVRLNTWDMSFINEQKQASTFFEWSEVAKGWEEVIFS